MTKLKKKKKEKNSINSVRVVFILDYYTVKRTAAYERECTCTRRRSYSSSTTHTSTGEREFLTCTQFNSSRLDSIRAASTFSLMKTLLRFSLSLSLSLSVSLCLSWGIDTMHLRCATLGDAVATCVKRIGQRRIRTRPPG